MFSPKKLRSHSATQKERTENHLRSKNQIAVSISDIDNDSLEHIFTFLPIAEKIKIERVCKRWKALSLSSWTQFKRLELSKEIWGLRPSGTEHKLEDISLKTLKSVLRRCGQFLISIDFSGYPHDCSFDETIDIIIPISQFCPNIISINLTNCFKGVITPEIKKLAKACHKIEDLKLSNKRQYGLGYDNVCDDELSLLFLNNKNIKSLCLENFALKKKVLTKLPNNSLQELILNTFKYTMYMEIEHTILNAKLLRVFKCKININICYIIEALCSNGINNLEELNLNNKYSKDDENDFNNEIEKKLTKLFKMSKKLKIIELNHLAITGKCLLYLNSEIQKIYLEHCVNFDRSFVDKCLASFTKINSFQFHLIQQEPIISYPIKIENQCSNLKSFSVHGDSLLLSIKTIILLTNLSVLQLSCNSSVTDDILKIIGSKLTKLTSINLFRGNFTDIGLSAITNLPNLKALSISETQVTGEGFNYMPNIIKLDCKGCRGIESHYMLRLIKLSEKLEYLNLEWCSKLTNEFIDEVINIKNERKNKNILTMGIRKTRINIQKIKIKSKYLILDNIGIYSLYIFEIP